MSSGFSFTAEQKDKLNDTALRYHIARQSENKAELKRSGTEMVCIIYDYINRHKYSGGMFADEEFCQNIIESVWDGFLDKWSDNGGDGDFANYMSKTVKLRYLDRCKANKESNEKVLWLDADFDNDNGSDKAGNLHEIIASKTETSSVALEFAEKVNMIAYGVNANKKKMQSSPKYDYIPLYYTEFMSLLRYYGLSADDFKDVSEEVWETLEQAFLDSYCVTNCTCWKELFETEYKKLSEVTGDPKDSGVLCVTVSKNDLSASKSKGANYTKRVANVNAKVFLNYISKTAKSGTYVKTEADISNTRTKKFLPFIDAVLKSE